jgi:hypothetical protein
MNMLQRKDRKNVLRIVVIYGHGLVSIAPLAAKAPEVPTGGQAHRSDSQATPSPFLSR